MKSLKVRTSYGISAIELESDCKIIFSPFSAKATYEVRDYPARKWVSTDNVATDIHGGIEHSVSFDRLFQYISGNNVNNTKIDMTSPVTFFIKRNEDPEAEKEFTMSFYIPAVHQDEPIQPQAENVFIENRASFRVRRTRLIS